MTTTEHLARIAAKCRELLAIAEKRTPGKWFYHDGDAWDQDGVTMISSRDDGTSAYIAACAGPAESGWRSTIAAIEMACEMRAHLLAEFGDGWRCNFVDDKIKLILAAWPEDLL